MSLMAKMAAAHSLDAPCQPRPASMSRIHLEETGFKGSNSTAQISILTGGGDKPYALGLAAALIEQGVAFDFIGSDYVDDPSLHNQALVHFLNLRGNQDAQSGQLSKAWRVLKYYAKLIAYASSARPKIFHILWNNKFEFFDRTFLLLYYKLLGKKLVLTAHNVNTAARDSADTALNRLSLRIQYSLADSIFVHTEKMKIELLRDFSAPDSKVIVIPFGINNTLPNTALTSVGARQRLGFGRADKVILFFGNIAPYKGVEYLASAWAEIAPNMPDARLVVAGRLKAQDASYWDNIHKNLVAGGLGNRVLEKIEYIPDEDVEIYFKAADVLILPYTTIFQSGVLFLGYSFGLPVIAADVGSLKEDIIEGETGVVFPPRSATHLAKALTEFFRSDLYLQLSQRRQKIRDFANDRYSWGKVAKITTACYSNLLDHD